MRRALRWAAALTILFLAAIQVVRPARTNPSTDPARTLAARMHVTPEAAAVLDRSCRDCHSNETRWPWYSNVAPLSWFVIDHVNHGRSHFNYSDWAQYDSDDARRLLKNACELSREQAMPMRSYLLMHRAAGLTARDVEALCNWTRTAMP